MKKFFTNKYVLFGLGFIALILVWFIVSKVVDVDNMILPGPQDTFSETIELLKQKATYDALLFSLGKLALGFTISFGLAFVLGLIVHDNQNLYNFFVPIITFFKSVPTATFVFFFIVLSGVENASMLVVVTVTFPILYEAVVSSFKHTNKEIVEASQLDGANKLDSLLRVQLPNGLPYIFLGIVSSFSLAFKVEIMSEVIMGYTKGGLGALIKGSQIIDPTNLTTMFAYSLIAVVLMIVITIAVNILKSYLSKRLKISI